MKKVLAALKSDPPDLIQNSPITSAGGPAQLSCRPRGRHRHSKPQAGGGAWGASSFLWRDSSSGHSCTWHCRHVTHTKGLQDRCKPAQEPAPPGPAPWTGSDKKGLLVQGQVAGSQLSATFPGWRGLSRGHLAMSGDIFDCHNWEAAPGRGRGCC